MISLALFLCSHVVVEEHFWLGRLQQLSAISGSYFRDRVGLTVLRTRKPIAVVEMGVTVPVSTSVKPQIDARIAQALGLVREATAITELRNSLYVLSKHSRAYIWF